MKASDFSAFCVKHSLANERAAVIFGVSEQAIVSWILGKRSVPGPAQQLAKVLDQYPQLFPVL